MDVMRRVVLVVGGGVAVLAGCLFPSFDDLKKDGSAAPGDDDDNTTERTDSGSKPGSSASSASSGSSASSTSSTSSSGSTTSSASSSGGDASSGAPKTIRCGSKTCAATEVCCGEIVGDPACKPAASNPDCDTVLVCDGAQDCGPGQSCCQNGTGGSDSLCRAGACSDSEYTYCQPDAPICPGGQICTGGSIGPHVDINHCQ